MTCSFQSVSPSNAGSPLQHKFTVAKQQFDPSKSVLGQVDYLVTPNQLGLYLRSSTSDQLVLADYYKTLKLEFERTQAGLQLKLTQIRGGGTGYGTQSFLVTAIYSCVE